MKKKIPLLTITSILLIAACFWTYMHTKASEETVRVEDELQAQEMKTIVIDPGHGGYDSGSISINGVMEKDITLAIALKTGALLEGEGYHVIYTRESDDVTWSDDNLDDLQSRVTIGEENNAAYYISIHTNASENYDDGAYGFETYLKEHDDTMKTAASSISENLMNLSYTQNRGLKTTQERSLYVIDSNPVSAMLIEVGFLTDSDDAAYMTSEHGQSQIAQAIADGIIENL